MTAFQPIPGLIELVGSSDTETLLSENFINPITGGTGITTIKCDLSQATTPATVEYTPTSTTYTFEGVTGTASDSGADATFTVVVGISSVIATLTDIGNGYTDGETITIDATEYGGAGLLDNIVVTITEVDTDGGIVAFTQALSGNPPWPQGLTGSFLVPAVGTTFVQLNSGTTPDGVYISVTGSDGTLYVQAVTIVG